MDYNDKSEEISGPSDENCNDKESNDPPQTSIDLILPETAINMKDLKALDFNSADEVRQRMKAVFAGKGPQFEENAEDIIVNVGDHEQQLNKLRLHLMSKLTGTDDLKLGDQNMLKTIKPGLSKKKTARTSRRRPGRPPKAGPSKKFKKKKISTLYLGKLSNVVFLKRHRRSNH